MSSRQLHCSKQVPVHSQGDGKGPGGLRVVKGRGSTLREAREVREMGLKRTQPWIYQMPFILLILQP